MTIAIETSRMGNKFRFVILKDIYECLVRGLELGLTTKICRGFSGLRHCEDSAKD